ncbi:ABC transporter permease [Demequina salsinemoris]|uniref:ABC transporter permease n=1 Tax=Demequina salsinemoris TaxID=577470 RepID=UPI0007834EC8|nr:ABC transporter permease subunit [Demequina salsinemoris]
MTSGPPLSADAHPRRGAALGLLPFGAFTFLFLAVPTVLAVGSGLYDADGHLTADNLIALGDPVILKTLGNSVWLAALTAALGTIGGAAICYALIGVGPESRLRTFVDAASGVLAQFAGVPLAFAYIAAFGLSGLVTVWLQDTFGFDLYASGAWIYEMPGLIAPYVAFQLPLMVIVFLPALDALRPEWAEANAILGGGRATYWRRVGLPVLAPSLIGAALLLFANAFSAYGTAAALISQGSQIIPLQIRAALSSETVLGHANLAGALALAMIAIMAAVMALYAALDRRASRWRR